MKKTLLPLLFVLTAASYVSAADAPATGPAGVDQWMAYNHNGTWGFVDRDSPKVEFVIAPAYEMAFPFRQNRAAVRKEKLWGFIDSKGTLVIPCQYDEIQRGVFRSGVAVVKKAGLYGVIDLDGKEILPLKFKSVTLDDKEGRIVAAIEDPADATNYSGLSGLYDLTGKQLMPNEYQYMYAWFKGGVTVVMKAGKYALASNTGQLLTPLQYDQVLHSDISHFIAIKTKEQVNDLYDANGKLLFSAAPYPYVGPVVDNRSVFKDPATKLNGYFDEKGKIVIEPKFVLAGAFSEGLAIVQRATGGPIEAIDTAGKTVGTATNSFIRLDKFKNGTVWLADKTDKKIYLHNTKLEKVFPQGFYYAADFDVNGLSRAQAAAKQNGLINKKGEWVLQPEWTNIELSSIPGQYIVTKDKEKGIVNSAGEVVFKPQAISIEKWDADFVKISPPGFFSNGEYFCFWRKDGVYFYDQKKEQ